MEIYVHLLFVELEYLLTEKNSLCSDTSDTPVDAIKRCKHAADKINEQLPNSQFMGEVYKEYWPRGCYLVTNPSRVGFNLHLIGSRNNQAHHICSLPGKE